MTDDVEKAYRNHGPAVLQYLHRMCGDRDLAADVLQETFATLIERPPEEDGNLRGWLFRVATNRLRDARRKTSRRTAALQRVAPGRVHGDPAPHPSRRVERHEAEREAWRMLDALGERDRMVLLMRAEGFAHREIAAAVDTTTGSVGTLIARALDRAARHVERERDHG